MLQTILLIFVFVLNGTHQSGVFEQVDKVAQFNGSGKSGKATLLVPDKYLKVIVKSNSPVRRSMPFSITFANCSLDQIYYSEEHYYIRGVEYDFPIKIEVQPVTISIRADYYTYLYWPCDVNFVEFTEHRSYYTIDTSVSFFIEEPKLLFQFFGSVYPPIPPPLEFLPYKDNTEVLWIVNAVFVVIIVLFLFSLFWIRLHTWHMEREFKWWNKRITKTYEKKMQEARDQLQEAQRAPLQPVSAAPLQPALAAPNVQEQELLLTAIEKEDDGLKTAILTPDVNVNMQPANRKEESMKTGKEKEADAQMKTSPNAAKTGTGVVSVDLAPQ
ncbi:hypothetical protein M3Y95_00925900 [Aphelenchoides besseyi]|nr:hypothetical protein M3Y95_00925900 [Aphelenchoides besseyi]